jgi:hypothetical protein
MRHLIFIAIENFDTCYVKKTASDKLFFSCYRLSWSLNLFVIS